MRVVLFCVLLTFACAAPSLETGDRAPEEGRRRADPFPPASGPLELGPLADATLGEWLDALVRLTGQRILLTDEMQARLQTTMPDLRSATTSVPAEEVYPLIEGMLVEHGFYLVNAGTLDDPLLSLRGPHRSSGAPATFLRIRQEDLHLLRLHPALVMAVVLELPNTDVRQLTTSMRGMMTDVNTQALLPMGDRSIVVRGMGGFLDGIVAVLLDAEEQNARAHEARRQALENAPEPSER